MLFSAGGLIREKGAHLRIRHRLAHLPLRHSGIEGIPAAAGRILRRAWRPAAAASRRDLGRQGSAPGSPGRPPAPKIRVLRPQRSSRWPAAARPPAAAFAAPVPRPYQSSNYAVRVAWNGSAASARSTVASAGTPSTGRSSLRSTASDSVIDRFSAATSSTALAMISARLSVSVHPPVHPSASALENAVFPARKTTGTLLPKLDVEGSSPFARFRCRQQGGVFSVVFFFPVFRSPHRAMATRNPIEASIAELRSLFTTGERKILDSSTGKALTTATERQVKDLLRQCRTLRDKWRDLVGDQTRKVKRDGRVGASRGTTTPANDRSRQKHSLLSNVVAHLETHLGGITGQSRSPAAGATATKPAPKSSAAKKASKSPIAGGSAARVSGTKTATAKAAKASASRPGTTASTAKSVSRKARQAGTIKALESSALSGLRTTKAGQQKASAALKAERLKLKGVTTRRAGHAQVQGSRSQARRDGRNAQR